MNITETTTKIWDVYEEDLIALYINFVNGLAEQYIIKKQRSRN